MRKGGAGRGEGSWWGEEGREGGGEGRGRDR